MDHELSERGKSVWRVYLSLHGVFAFLFGVFASYCYLYLGVQVRLAGGLEYIPSSFLPLMAATLLFESVSAPFAGAYADSRGRKAAVALGFKILALSYAFFASLPLIRAMMGSEAGFWVSWTGAAGLAFMTLAVSFHSNALDAWFVDSLRADPKLRREGASANVDLHPFFARQAQVFGFFLLVGGVLALWLGKDLADSARKETLLFFSPGSAIWGLAVAAALLMARKVTRTMGEAPAAKPIALRERLDAVLASRELVRALTLASAVYLCSLTLTYFLPRFLHDSNHDENALVRALVGNYTLFYVLMGLTRVFGPAIALKLGPARPNFDRTPMAGLNLKGFAFRKRQARFWGTLAFGGVAASGLAFLLLPRALFVLPLLVIIGAKLAVEAFKPVQASYLNELIPNSASSNRAFAVSLSTPFGSAVLGTFAFVVIGLQGASPGDLPTVLEQASLGIPLVFGFFGLLTLLLVRSMTRPAKPYFSSSWRERFEKIREDIRREDAIQSSRRADVALRSATRVSPRADDGETFPGPFIRPLGAGDLPAMRPEILKTLDKHSGELRSYRESPSSAPESPAVVPGLRRERGEQRRGHLRVVRSGGDRDGAEG